MNENPNYGREAVSFFFIKKSIIDNIWPLDWRGYFEQGIKWDAPLGLDFELGVSRLHTMPTRRLHLLYFIGYFQLILWILNKVWPLNPTTSQLGRP
jgi:hypothetical protein